MNTAVHYIYFVGLMVEQGTIGQFEQLAMTASPALADNAYGDTIHATVSELAAPKSVSLGAVYATLDRPEDKGLITLVSEQVGEQVEEQR